LPIAAGARVALVIGNGAYTHVAELANPKNDAAGVAKALRAIGFEVSVGIDLDRDNIDRLMRAFLLSVTKARIAVLFYAGHGMQIDGRNFLVPVDAKFNGVSDIATEMTDADTILASLDDKVRTNIVVLDACRNNPVAQTIALDTATGRSINVRAGLAMPTELGKGLTIGAGTLIAFATAPNQVALDGEGENSPFSTALMRHVGTPGLEVQQMLTRVRAEVVAATKNKQIPWSNSSLLGEVYLAEKL
jgi:uncharacterized caspase-like protein